METPATTTVRRRRQLPSRLVAWLSLAVTALFAILDGVLPNIAYRRRTGRLLIRHGSGASGWLAMAWVATVFLAGPLADIGGLNRLTSSPALVVAGVALVLAGLTTVFLAQRTMGDSLRIGIDPSEQTALVNRGIFALVRNPIYSAMILYAAGTAALVPNILSFSVLACFVTTMEYQVRLVEEPYLRRTHGDSYAEYLARVGRFVPGVGRARPPDNARVY